MCADPKNKLRLTMTDKIYAAPGVECNIYFNNILTVINHRNYAFEVRCKVGRSLADRWQFVPEEKDAGEYPLVINIYDNNGLAVTTSTTVIVTASTDKPKKLSLLLIGDSQTSGIGYPEHLFSLLQNEQNLDFSMIGTNSGNYAAPVPGGVAHEGYGGWSWQTFFENHDIDENDNNDGMHPRRPSERNSRFLFPENGKYKFDLKLYCEKYNNGVFPDTVIIMLGTNDVFCPQDDKTLQIVWDTEIYPYMKRMMSGLREYTPDIRIAWATIAPGANDQDAFGLCYNSCSYHLWRWRLNLHFYHQKLFEAAKEFNIELIPVHCAIDCENNFPVAEQPISMRNQTVTSHAVNAVHPALAGYQQIGDEIFAYLKAKLN